MARCNAAVRQLCRGPAKQGQGKRMKKINSLNEYLENANGAIFKK